MQVLKYSCNQCDESFEILRPYQTGEVKCPRCGSKDITELNSCSIEIGPPPWEYICQQCNTRFRVKSPHGPDEASIIRCPICKSKHIKWLVNITQACATGG